jgi:hypothetical protein
MHVHGHLHGGNEEVGNMSLTLKYVTILWISMLFQSGIFVVESGPVSVILAENR